MTALFECSDKKYIITADNQGFNNLSLKMHLGLLLGRLDCAFAFVEIFNSVGVISCLVDYVQGFG